MIHIGVSCYVVFFGSSFNPVYIRPVHITTDLLVWSHFLALSVRQVRELVDPTSFKKCTEYGHIDRVPYNALAQE